MVLSRGFASKLVATRCSSGGANPIATETPNAVNEMAEMAALVLSIVGLSTTRSLSIA